MASFKEIVTKAVIGKGKKTFITTNDVTPNCQASTILGCWVINHNFKGYKNGNTIKVEGSYDINIWYSCENDTKTDVIRQTDTYSETVVVPKRNETNIAGEEEIIVRSLKQPSCVKAEIKDGKIIYTIEKELGIELVGDTKVKIAIDEDEDEWDLIEDGITNDENNTNIQDKIDKQIDEQVKEEFLD